MDEIVFFCTNCGTNLSAEPNEAGEEFDCPKCNAVQTVPGGKAKPEAPATKKPATTKAVPEGEDGKGGQLIVRIPKRKIVMASKASARDTVADTSNNYNDKDFDEIGGGGLRAFAVAVGAVGVVLCLLSLACGYFSMDREDVEWWFKIMIFMSTFLSGLMGLMLANFAFLAVRMGERLDDLSEE